MGSDSDLAPDPDRERLLDRLIQLPDEFQPRLKAGFHRLSALPPEVRSRLIDEILSRMGEGRSPRPSEVAIAVGMEVADLGDTTIAATVLFGILLDLEVGAEKFLDISERRLFDERDRPAVAEMVRRVVSDRSRLKAATEVSSLAKAVLPAFSRMDVELDVRLRFKGDKLALNVPIAIAYIDTDCEDQDLWIQLTKGDIRHIVNRLEEVERQISLAEKLMATIS
jgi:hypothetical protein